MSPYFKYLLESITLSIMSIQEDKFQELVNESVRTLEKGNKIVVSGLGKNVPICEKFVGTMLSMGLNANFLHTNSAVHGDIGMVKRGDLVIVLTKSGETEESIYLTNLLLKRKVNIWLLTFTEKSALTNIISKSIIIHLNHEGDMWNIVPNNSTTMNLIILQALAMNIVSEMGVTLEQFKENHPGGHIGVILNE